MDTQLLKDIGLTAPQAAAYQALIEAGTTTAPDIAARTYESRSNAYKVLDKLCELGLAVKNESTGKIQYQAVSPAALERLVGEKATAAQLQESKLNAALPGMLDFFFAHSEQAAIRFFQGKEGMQQMYTEMLKTGQTLYLLRSPSDLKFYDADFFTQLSKKRVALGIKTVSITPDVPSANHDPALDTNRKLTRTWIGADEYTAPVEWNVAGNKVALISFGEEAFGVLIESAQIAESFRQMFQLTRAALASRRDAARPQ